MDDSAARIDGNGRLERVNVMLSPQDRKWLSEITGQFRSRGVDISGSEVVRAALAALRELRAIAPDVIRACRSGTDMEVAGIAAIRLVRYTPMGARLK